MQIKSERILSMSSVRERVAGWMGGWLDKGVGGWMGRWRHGEETSRNSVKP